ncbi:MAG: methyltransferase domain-containing protein [Bacteroidetes bacterium]|nr:MAG: methyltransferase domain-containing protein [Bacteroidota bacterium]
MNKKMITNLEALDGYLKKIDRIFPIQELIGSQINHAKITKYYKDSFSGYKYIHSRSGAVHMALNYDGKFDREGFYTQVKEIHQMIQERPVQDVLELGCGQGFNSIYLAKLLPEVQFQGVDITQKHLDAATKKARGISNVCFDYGDFQQLQFPDNHFDLIFELEAVCHANDMRQALSEIHRVLKEGGQAVLYDGYRSAHFENLTASLKTATQLTEKSMAVERFIQIDQWIKIAEEVGFKIRIQDNLSEAIMPSLEYLQGWARGYYKYYTLSKFFNQVLPRDLVMNSIAGILMPFVVHHEALVYYKVVLEK